MRSANSTPPVGVNRAKQAPSKRRNGRRAASSPGTRSRPAAPWPREIAVRRAPSRPRRGRPAGAGRVKMALAEVGPQALPGRVRLVHHARVSGHRTVGEAGQPMLVAGRGERIGDRALLVQDRSCPERQRAQAVHRPMMPPPTMIARMPRPRPSPGPKRPRSLALRSGAQHTAGGQACFRRQRRFSLKTGRGRLKCQAQSVEGC